MSHNTMATFYSGTDLNTLKVEGADRNHFLSLIVNNAGEYTAAITRKIKSISTGTSAVSYNTFGNIEVNGGTTSFEQESFYVEYYPLEITVEKIPEEPKSELELRLEEVKNSAKSYINRPKNWDTFTPKWGNTVIPASSPNVVKTETIAADKPKYTQLTLFDDKEYSVETPAAVEVKEDDNGLLYSNLDVSIPYGSSHVDKEVIDNTIKQVITGDIFSIYKNNIDLDKWVNNMEKLYDKRFNSPANEDFGYWVDSIVEWLSSEVEDPKFKNEDVDVKAALWAYDVIVELDKMPANPYLDYIIKAFERWLL